MLRRGSYRPRDGSRTTHHLKNHPDRHHDRFSTFCGVDRQGEMYSAFRYVICMSDEIPKRLQQARTNAGFKTASDAARRFGWNENTYRSHENGERGLKKDVVFKYARAFGVSPVFLLIDTDYSSLDYSGTWRPIAGQIDDLGSTNVTSVAPRPSEASHFAIFDFSVEKRIVVLEYVGPREFGIFTSGDLLIFADGSSILNSVGHYCLIEHEKGKYIVRLLRSTESGQEVDIALRAIDPPKLVKPRWLGSLFLLVPRGRWDKEETKVFVNRAVDPRSF